MKKLYAALVVLALLCASASATEILKASHSVAPSHPYHLGLVKYAELVTERTNGAVTIDIFHSAQLGNERDNIEGLQMGTLDICVTSTGPMGGFEPRFFMFDLPFLFRDREHVYKVLDGTVGQELLKKLIDVGIVGAAYWENGFRQVTNSKRPINSVNDIKGLKLRTMENQVHIDAFRALGVDPTPMAWSEVFTALQQGVIDGQENPHLINRDAKFWEVQKYITDIHYMLWVAPILVSERWFAKLDPDTRELFVRAAREAAEYEWKWSEEEDAKALQQCIDGGMVIGTVSDEDKWAEKARSVWPKFYDTVGGKQFVDQALEAMK